jgi:hypothetical protein
MNKINNVCYYHAECLDGWAAALGVFTHLEGDVHLIPAVYKETIPRAEGCNVWIVDFCFDLETTCKLVESNNYVTIVDHHKGAEPTIIALQEWAELAGVEDKLTIKFAKDQSGALLTWRLYKPDDSFIPPWVFHVSDYDLWQFKIEHSEAVATALMSYDFKLEDLWIGICNPENALAIFPELLLRGYGIIDARDNNIKMLIRYARPIEFAGHVVPMVNAPRFINSMLLDRLGEDQPFAIGYHEDGDHWKYSFRRPTNSVVDLNALLKPLGGGGHEAASGLRLPMNKRNAQETLADALWRSRLKNNSESRFKRALKWLEAQP